MLVKTYNILKASKFLAQEDSFQIHFSPINYFWVLKHCTPNYRFRDISSLKYQLYTLGSTSIANWDDKRFFCLWKYSLYPQQIDVWTEGANCTCLGVKRRNVMDIIISQAKKSLFAKLLKTLDEGCKVYMIGNWGLKYHAIDNLECKALGPKSFVDSRKCIGPNYHYKC